MTKNQPSRALISDWFGVCWPSGQANQGRNLCWNFSEDGDAPFSWVCEQGVFKARASGSCQVVKAGQ